MQEANTREGKHVGLIVRHSPMKVGWWDTPLPLRDLAKAIPIISGNGLPLLTKNNFQTPPPPVYWYLGYLSHTASPHYRYYLELQSTGIKKENLLLAHYSHYSSTYLEYNKLKNEAREMATNVRSTCNLFLMALFVDHTGNT